MLKKLISTPIKKNIFNYNKGKNNTSFIVLVNFDNNNIISDNLLDIMPIFVDGDEFDLNKKSKQEPPKKEKNLC